MSAKRVQIATELFDDAENGDNESMDPDLIAKQTAEYSDKHKLSEILLEFMKKSFIVKSNTPLRFIADEINKLQNTKTETQINIEKLEKTIEAYKSLIENLKARNKTESERTREIKRENNPISREDFQKGYNFYINRHQLRRAVTELISISFMDGSDNPLQFIAKYIYAMPETLIFARADSEQLQKKIEIYVKIVKQMTEEIPLKLDEIMFSCGTLALKNMEQGKITSSVADKEETEDVASSSGNQ